MQEDKAVIMYGAGDFGQKLYALLRDCGITPFFSARREMFGKGRECVGCLCFQQSGCVNTTI